MSAKEYSTVKLNPRELSFIKEAMKNIESDEGRRPTEKVEAGRVREQIETALTK
jgi:hypothetical protein